MQAHAVMRFRKHNVLKWIEALCWKKLFVISSHSILKAMAVFLQNRFLDSIQSLNRFMELTGVRLVPFDSPNTWKKYFYKLWSVIFLIICVQSNIFIVMKRSCLLYRFISCPQWFDNFIGEFTKVLILISQLISDTTVHVSMILTLQTTVSIFLSILKSIDDILKQPSLIRLKQFSLFGLIYLLITVSEIVVYLESKFST